MTSKKIKTSDILGDNYYIYELSSSNYTPSLNASITITCTCKTVYGNTVNNKSLTLHQNGSSVSSQTTNSSGIATWTITCSSAGVQRFNIGDSIVEVFVDTTSKTGHTHTVSNITDFPSTITPSSHTHGNLQNDGSIGTSNNASKNVVTDSNGKITTEAKPTIPSASSTTPSADTSSGSYGSGTDYARANHQHPQSSLYAEASHSHGDITNDGKITATASYASANDKILMADYSDGKIKRKHNILTSQVTDSNVYVNFNTTADATQSTINTEIDTVLSNKADSNHSHDFSELNDDILGSLAYENDIDLSTHDVSELTDDYDTTFTPKSHTHTVSNITDFPSTMTPSSHAHGNITNDGKVGSDNGYFVTTTTGGAVTSQQKIGNIDTSGKIGSTSGKPLITTTGGTVTTGAFGTSSGQFAEGNHTHSGYVSATKVTSWSGTVSDSNVPSEKLVKDSLDGKQATLVSGTNIKTINNNSILGSGNISIGGGGGSLTFDDVYPIGSIYMSVNSTNPSVLFGGTWEQIEDRFLLASGSTYTNGATGGSADAIVVEHTHTQNAHYHKPYDSTSFVETNATALATGSTKRVATSNTSGNFYWQSNQSSEPTITRHTVTANATATNQNTGESGTGKNMPPYLVVYVWKRVA